MVQNLVGDTGYLDFLPNTFAPRHLEVRWLEQIIEDYSHTLG